jgi:hypothetical protein
MQVVTSRLNVSEGFGVFQDLMVKDFVVRYGCAFKYDPSAPCQVLEAMGHYGNHLALRF